MNVAIPSIDRPAERRRADAPQIARFAARIALAVGAHMGGFAGLRAGPGERGTIARLPSDGAGLALRRSAGPEYEHSFARAGAGDSGDHSLPATSPCEQATPGALPLSLDDAIGRGE